MLTKLYNKIFPSIQSERVKLWRRSGGEELRYKYDLDDKSLVIDLGGYKGEWTSNIFSRYASTILIFEPIAQYAKQIRDRFLKNKKISMFEFGLSDENKEIDLQLNDDSTSQFKNGGPSEKIKLIKASDFFTEKKINVIDLMKINIEGGEYDLLEHLIETGWISKIKNIQVQFHDFVPNAKDRMTKIKNDLRKTHHTTYEYEFVWENWKLN